MNPKKKALLCNILMLLAVFAAGWCATLFNIYQVYNRFPFYLPGGGAILPFVICLIVGLLLGLLQGIKQGPCRFRMDISRLILGLAALLLGSFPIVIHPLSKIAPGLTSAAPLWLMNDISTRIFALLAGGFLVGAFYGPKWEEPQ